MPLKPIYRCGVGQALADLKAVSDQMLIDAGYVAADKSVDIYVHGKITDNTGTQLFSFPYFGVGNPFTLTVQGNTGKTIDEVECLNFLTTIQSSNFTFKNLKFSGGTRAPWILNCDNSGHDNCIFDNCKQSHYNSTNGFIKNNLFTNILEYGLVSSSEDINKPIIIENNIFSGFTNSTEAQIGANAIIRNNLFINGALGIYFSGSIGNNKVYNNIFMNYTYAGMRFFATGGTAQGNQVYNNTFYNNNFGIHAFYLNNEGNIIKNNLFIVKSGQQGFQFDPDNRNQTLDYNFYEVQAGGILGAVHNGTAWQTFTTLAALRAVYPQYETNGSEGVAELVNPGGTGAQDYKLKAISAAIDKGLDLSAVFAVDFNNKTRPKGASFDCGAFEAPYITLTGVLSSYSTDQAGYIQATATITGTATGVYVVINGKTFPLTATGGGVYTLAIRGFDIGICAGASVIFYAFNDDYNVQYTAPVLTVVATNNYNIDAIEVSIVNILNTITDFKSVLQNEPKQIPALPAATLYYDGFDQDQTEAVSFTITHKWLLRLYVKLHDAEDAQNQLKLLIGKTLAALKLDIDFGNSVLFGMSPAGSTSVLMDRDNPTMIAELTLTAMIEVD